MPFISEHYIKLLLDKAKTSANLAIVPMVNGNIEPLFALYSSRLMPLLETYIVKGNSKAVYKFLKQNKVCYLELEDDEFVKRTFTNINRPADLKELGF